MGIVIVKQVGNFILTNKSVIDMIIIGLYVIMYVKPVFSKGGKGEGGDSTFWSHFLLTRNNPIKFIILPLSVFLFLQNGIAAPM